MQLRFCCWMSLFLAPLLLLAQDYELVLRGGRLIDGAGNPAHFADLAVNKGRIVAVGKITGTGAKELDCTGLVVTPGFIDVHTHADDPDELPLAENFVRMGVTTVVAGNCGSSVLQPARLFQRMESTSISVNLATLVGHGTVRNQAMGGSSNRKPTTRELQKMKDLVTRAMEQGALGLSTGLIYSPGEWASTEEIVELARIVASCNGLYASHMRGEGTNIFSSLNELFRVSREAGLPAHISHIKLSGKAAWGHADQVLALINKARDGGLDITQDQYVYTASSTSLGQVIPDEYKEGGKFTKNLADAAIKARMIEEMKSMVARGKRDDYSYAVIAYCRHNPALNGLNVAQAALKVRSSDSLDEQVELILDIQKNGGATGIFHGINEQDLQTFLQHPNTMFASDSGLRRFGEGVPHPRGYGNNARVLSHYVRELKLLRLEEAVRRMTCLPATTFHLKDRGLLREGAWADIAVFDPAKVQDESTFKEPHHYAIGFAYVLVNGTVVIDHDKHTGTRPGQAIRRGL